MLNRTEKRFPASQGQHSSGPLDWVPTSFRLRIRLVGSLHSTTPIMMSSRPTACNVIGTTYQATPAIGRVLQLNQTPRGSRGQEHHPS